MFFVCLHFEPKAIGIDTFNRMRYDPRTIPNTFLTRWLQRKTKKSIRGHSKINTEKHENKIKRVK